MAAYEFQKNSGIIGKSKAIQDIVDIAMQIAKSDISVLIYGESGVGKEVFAQAIHQFSDRVNKRIVNVNCGAIPEGLLESELFGHKKGSFTGATTDRKGYFEIADSGTLFLDEIAEMPLTTQVKLLRVLETKEFMPVGSETVKKVDVRIIAAANKDLEKEVDKKNFRKDLYFRLKAVTLNIPALRERREDISLLANHFLKIYSDNNNIPGLHITVDALDLLTQYHWPGNVRELKNTIETAAALSRTGIIDVSSFKNLLSGLNDKDDIRHLPVHLNKSPESLDREMIYRALIEIKKDLMELKQVAYKNIEDNHKFADHKSDETENIMSLAKSEKKLIIRTMEYTRYNKRRAAQLLDVSERTLYRKLKDYGIE